MRQPFKGIENLEAAYDLETPEDNIKLYAAWADTYDAGYRTSMDYILHQHVGEAYHSVNGGPKVLDMGRVQVLLQRFLGCWESTTLMQLIFRKRCWMWPLKKGCIRLCFVPMSPRVCR